VTWRKGWILTSLVALPPLLVGAAAAQTLGLTQGADRQPLPVNITADNGIEWRQAQHVYIARGHVKAVRGQVTVYADEMDAFYRPTAKNVMAKAPPPRKPGKSPGVNLDEGSTEIYRLVAIGHVRFVTPTETAYGDHADYDVDTARLVMTGQHLRAFTQHDTLTARDSLEWYDKRQLGVARGRAVDYHDGKTISADVLMETLVHRKGEPARVSRIDATGHVVITSRDQIGRGDTGVYNATTGIATLSGHVQLVRGPNELRGAYGVIDLNRNVGWLLPAPPGTKPTPHSDLRVEGLIVPSTRKSPPPRDTSTRKHHPPHVNPSTAESDR
jgi:lipopolysaccharide export system protein LptA